MAVVRSGARRQARGDRRTGCRASSPALTAATSAPQSLWLVRHGLAFAQGRGQCRAVVLGRPDAPRAIAAPASPRSTPTRAERRGGAGSNRAADRNARNAFMRPSPTRTTVPTIHGQGRWQLAQCTIRCGMSQPLFIRSSVDRHVGWLEFNRPPVNAFTREMVDETHDAIAARAGRSRGARAGAGKRHLALFQRRRRPASSSRASARTACVAGPNAATTSCACCAARPSRCSPPSTAPRWAAGWR